MAYAPPWALLALLVSLGCRPVSGGTGAAPSGVNATVADVKEYYRVGEIGTVGADLTVDAVVVAGPWGGNFRRRVVLQDETGGLVLDLGEDSASFMGLREGALVVLRARGLSVGGFGGVVRLAGPELGDRLTLLGRGVAAVPTPVAAYALRPRHYSTLVRVCGVQLADADATGTWGDTARRRPRNLRFEDCGGNGLTVRTNAGASFAAASPPTGGGCVTGVAGAYRGSTQLYLRTAADAALDGERCAPRTVSPPAKHAGETGVSEAFDDLGDDVAYARPGWTNHRSGANAGAWTARRYRGNGYVQVSAYGDDAAGVDAWLITPRVSGARAKTLSFRTAHAYYRHGGLEVLVSDDFGAGMSPGRANWRPVTARIAGANDPEHAWVESGAIALRGTSDSLAVAFRYRGSASGGATTTFRVDDVLLGP